MLFSAAADPLKEKTLGVSLIAALLVLAAVSGAALSLLMAINLVAITAGNLLVGPGLELFGPPFFLGFGLAAATAAWGLLRLRNWARWLTITLASVGLITLIPAISGAVTQLRYSSIIRTALEFQIRFLVIWYLMKPDVKDRYTSGRRIRPTVA
jgi:hypothetical protein